MYVKWDIKTQILRYVSARSIARNSNCPNSTLCTGENPYSCVHNAPIQQQQNKHWVIAPKQAQKEEFNKKKRGT